MAVEYSSTGSLYTEILNNRDEFKKYWSDVVRLSDEEYFIYAASVVLNNEIKKSTELGNEERATRLESALITLEEKLDSDKVAEIVESRTAQYFIERDH